MLTFLSYTCQNKHDDSYNVGEHLYKLSLGGGDVRNNECHKRAVNSFDGFVVLHLAFRITHKPLPDILGNASFAVALQKPHCHEG